MFVIQEFGVVEIRAFDKGRGPFRNRQQFLNGSLPALALQALVAFPQCPGDDTSHGFPCCLRNGRRQLVVGAENTGYNLRRICGEWQGAALNDRQRLVLNRLPDGFEGKLTTSKYAKLAKSSQDTALRDILPLVERGVLVRNPEGGRSTSYALACGLLAISNTPAYPFGSLR